MQEDLALNANIKLYYDLHLPEKTPVPLLIVLHGYGAHKRQMMREGLQIAPEGFAIASLQGFHQHLKDPKTEGGPLRFGFGWLTNFRPEESVAIHHRALLDLVEQLTAKDIADASRIFLLGFSQSCAINYRFAFTYPEKLKGVIGISGGVPGDWETSDSYKDSRAAVFHLTGTRDEFYTSERVKNYENQLRSRAANLKYKTYDAGHEIVQEMREDIKQWLIDHVD